MHIKNNKGFSLLEMIIAIGIYSIISVLTVQIFFSILNGQVYAIAAQNVQESMRYALEIISKEIRMAERSDLACVPDDDEEDFSRYKVYNFNPPDQNILIFKNKDGKCVMYYIDERNQFRVWRSNFNSGVVPNSIDIMKSQSLKLTPDDISINYLKYDIADESIDGLGIYDTQANVTFKMNVKASSTNRFKHEINLQTTITSRYYE